MRDDAVFWGINLNCFYLWLLGEIFLLRGRWREGRGAGFLLLFQNVRSPKHPAVTLWHRPGAAPSSPWRSASS